MLGDRTSLADGLVKTEAILMKIIANNCFRLFYDDILSSLQNKNRLFLAGIREIRLLFLIVTVIEHCKT